MVYSYGRGYWARRTKGEILLLQHISNGAYSNFGWGLCSHVYQYTIGELMRCPECEKVLKLPEYGVTAVITYNSAQMVKTLCCGKVVVVRPDLRYYVEKGDGRPTDDWGE